MAHVFISYSHIDRNHAREVRSVVQNNGFSVWTDDDIGLGDKWSEAIDEAIKDSFAMIVIVTPSSGVSQFVTYEWAHAIGAEIKVIPMLFKDVDSVHPKLSELHYLDFRAPSRSAWNHLIERLEAIERSHRAKQTPTIVIEAERNVLLRDLENPDHKVRRKAAQALGELKDESAVNPLIRCLDDEKWPVREASAEALGRLKDSSAIVGLVRRLKHDTSARARGAIAWALGEIGDVKAIDSLSELLYDKEDRVVSAAAHALRKIGDQSVTPALLERLRFASSHIQAAIIRTLAELKDERAIDVLITMLSSTSKGWNGSKSVRIDEAAAEALERIGTHEALSAVETWRKSQSEQS